MASETTSSPLIERTALRIRAELQGGRFGLNQPLLTHRAWAKELAVSHSTIGKAMELLRAEGVIESSEGSYTFLKIADSEKFDPAGGDQPEQSPIAIQMWHNGGKTFRRMRQAIVRQRFQETFSAKRPEVRFTEKNLEIPFESFRSRILESFVQGEGPTLGQIPQTYLEFLERHSALGEIAVEENERYLDLLDERYLEHSFVGGKCQFLPFGCSFSYLACNENLMRQAGLDPSEDFESWTGFVEVCERLKKAHGVAPLHVSEVGLFWLLSQWIYQADSTLPSEGRLPLICWNSEAARIGMDFLLEMIFDRKLIHVNRGDRVSQTSPFLAGQVPMMLDEIMLGTALELDQAKAFTLKLLPPGPNGTPLSLMNAVGWVGNPKLDNVTQTRSGEYILDWERWIHVGDGGSTMRKLGVAPNVFSLFKDASKDQFASNKLPTAWQRTFEQLKEFGRWEASNSDLVSSALTPILQAEIKIGKPQSSARVLKHLMLAQYEAGILAPQTQSPIQT